MAQIKSGDTAKVHYTGKLDDGTVFDSSRQGDPMEFEVGGGQLIQGFDEAVLGMSLGESKTVTIPSENAYGPYREEMVMEVERGQFPEGVSPEVGQHFEIPNNDGPPLVVEVKATDEEKVTLDANHPLAGKDLTFEIELVEVA
ncbi:MAG: peptidylprolyl isomerase [Desulfuromonas sp.]|uniref:FKBP-type peptidyl-prolyl cis-trans isomerase n=1 Tax=Desulfuromonas sp. TaxID=892 RepID=UPI000CAB034C|nr:peptidylprolyl isomerase [Desulfuromonas sp.]PLX86586.1 MAG: peptidylprolyl isomerase [Desulfuromonas sp.]